MCGNVWEQCEGSWRGKSSNNSAWVDLPGLVIRRDYRGGSWISNPNFCRVSPLITRAPGVPIGSVGFRLARSL